MERDALLMLAPEEKGYLMRLDVTAYAQLSFTGNQASAPVAGEESAAAALERCSWI